jgi:hypothetical protein
METFTIGLRSPWWVRALGRRNPLVRRSDRIEAMALLIAIVVSVAAIPIAGAIGMSVRDARAQFYTDDAQVKRQVIATATENGEIVPNGRSIGFSAEAAWSEAGRTHRGEVPWADWAKVGDQQSIWVNNEGEYVAAPPSPSQADGEAISVALLMWLGIAQAAAGLVYLVRHRLNRRRYTQWDREIDVLHESHGRRKYES